VLPEESVFWCLEPMVILGNNVVPVDADYPLTVEIAIICFNVYVFP